MARVPVLVLLEKMQVDSWPVGQVQVAGPGMRCPHIDCDLLDGWSWAPLERDPSLVRGVGSGDSSPVVAYRSCSGLQRMREFPCDNQTSLSLSWTMVRAGP